MREKERKGGGKECINKRKRNRRKKGPEGKEYGEERGNMGEGK